MLQILPRVNNGIIIIIIFITIIIIIIIISVFLINFFMLFTPFACHLGEKDIHFREVQNQ